MNENREHPRFDVSTSGTLVLDTGFKLDFVVKDMSQRARRSCFRTASSFLPASLLRLSALTSARSNGARPIANGKEDRLSA